MSTKTYAIEVETQSEIAYPILGFLDLQPWRGWAVVEVDSVDALEADPNVTGFTRVWECEPKTYGAIPCEGTDEVSWVTPVDFT